MRVDEGLNLGVSVPLLPVYLIPSDMKIGIGKELGHFLDELVQELVSLFFGNVHDRLNAPSLEGIGARTARQFRVSDVPGAAVARHLEFGEYANASVASVRHKFTDIVLCVVQAVRSHSVQLRKLPALDAEAFVVG